VCFKPLHNIADSQNQETTFIYPG